MEFVTFRYRDGEADYEHPRRDFLVRALTLGLFAAGASAGWPRAALAMSLGPEGLPPGRSVYRARGDVRVNGMPADRATRIAPNADIETGSDSEAIFVVGKDAFILRENSRLQLSPLLAARTAGGYCAEEDGSLAGSILDSLRLVSGRLLSVFGTREPDEPLRMHTLVATIGIRGTGVYTEAEPDRTYVCTCYGTTLLRATDDPASRETITSSHHDEPRYILGDGATGERIEPAPVIRHTDMELELIEALVGREPPFSGRGSSYGPPPGG